VLVTGGRGFLGSHVILRLAESLPAGCEIVSVDDGTRDCFDALGLAVPEGVRFVRGDVRRPEDWLPALAAPGLVVHCAALAGVSTYYRDPLAVLLVNGLGTARLLEALAPAGGGAAATKPDLFVNLSTSEVYGRDAEGADEGAATPVGPLSDPRWSYACSKVFAEHTAFAWSRRSGVPVVSLRPFNVYGPGQVGEGAVRLFCERAVHGEAIEVTGDGSQVRAWLYVDDFTDALLALLARPSAWGRTYNVGDPDARLSIADLARRVLRLARPGEDAGDSTQSAAAPALRFVPHPGQDVRARWPRTDALRAATGWAPRTRLDEGLRRTLDFWRGQARDAAVAGAPAGGRGRA
jgi:nucleoside-diphosphate-sugar epimerase